MEKTEAVGKLKKAGYQVQFDSSIVSVLLPAKANVHQEIKKLRAFLKEMGYDSSFGIKQVRDGSCREESKPEQGMAETRLEEEEQNLKEEPDLEERNSEEGTNLTESEAAHEEKEAELEAGRQFSLEDFGLS